MSDQGNSDLKPMGVEFQGDVDKSFFEAVARIESSLKGLDSFLKKTANSTGDASRNISGYGKVLSEVERRGKTFGQAVESIVRHFGKGSAETRGMVTELVKMDDEYKRLTVAGKDVVQVLGKEYTARNAALEAIRRYSEGAQGTLTKTQLLSRANQALATDMSDAKFASTALGRAIQQNADRSSTFHKALLSNSQQLGIHSVKTRDYAKSLAQVETHLQKVAQGGGAGSAKALKILNDEAKLGATAMKLYTGKIKLVEHGFVETGEKATTFTGILGRLTRETSESASVSRIVHTWARALAKDYHLLGLNTRDYTEILNQNIARHGSLERALRDTKIELHGLISEKQRMQAVLRKGESGLEAQKAAFAKLRKEQAATKEKAADLHRQYGGMGATLKDFEKILLRQVKRHGSLNRAYKDTKKQLEGIVQAQAAARREMALHNTVLGKFGERLRTVASFGLAASLSLMAQQGVREAISSIIEYDQALANLKAITSATDAEIEAMGQTILEVARRTKFSASEIADGLVYLGQSGFTAAESIASIQATADLAAGTLSGLEETADLMSSAIRAFNLEATDSSRVADVMANAVNKSKVNIDKLRTAFNYAGASSKQAGLDIEELAGSLMSMANNGMRASTMGTGLRGVLAKMLAPSKDLRVAFQEVGVNLSDVNTQTNSWETVLKNLSKVLYDTETKTIDMGAAYQLFGRRAAQAAAVLVKEYVGGGFEKAMENVYRVGSAAEMAGTQSEGLGFQIKNLGDVGRNVAVALGKQGVSGTLENLIVVLRGLLLLLESGVNSEMGSFAVQTVGAAAAVGSLVLAVKALSASLVFLGKSVGATTKKFTWIITVLAAVSSAVEWLSDWNERAARSTSKLAVETHALTEKAGAYQRALKDINGNLAGIDPQGRKYLSLVERMTEAHPELTQRLLDTASGIEGIGPVSELAALSAEQLYQVMEKFAKLNAAEDVKRFADAVDAANRVMQEARAGHGSHATSITRSRVALNEYREATDQTTESVHKSERALDEQIRGLVKAGVREIELGVATREDLEKTIRARELSAEKTKAAMAMIDKALTPKEELFNGFVNNLKVPSTGNGDNLYENLDARGRIDLLQMLRQHSMPSLQPSRNISSSTKLTDEEVHEMNGCGEQGSPRQLPSESRREGPPPFQGHEEDPPGA